jgi:hypothetical protein
MKKPFLFAVALLCGAFWVAQAQTQATYVTVKYTEQGAIKTDFFSMEGGLVQILNNSVMFVFAENPSLNRSYVFDDVNTMNFEQRNVSILENMNEENFKVFFDGNILHINAAQSVGKVSVYSITGARVAEVKSDAHTAQINLSALPKGTYIVQAGTHSVKIIK